MVWIMVRYNLRFLNVAFVAIRQIQIFYILLLFLHCKNSHAYTLYIIFIRSTKYKIVLNPKTTKTTKQQQIAADILKSVTANQIKRKKGY